MAAPVDGPNSKLLLENTPENPPEMEVDEDVDSDQESDDSSSDSIEADDDGNSNQHIINLEEQIQSNPYLYDVHVQLIKALRDDGELEKLRVARGAMNKYYPLSEELWLDWTQDEIKLLNPDSDRQPVYALFERATTDYQSVAIWLEYVQYTIGGMGTNKGQDKCRGVFESALGAVGLHVVKGSNIWEAYRELECALLATMQPDLGGFLSKEKEEAVEKQTDRITNLFKRQLAVPLFDMESTFKEYCEWADDEGVSLKPLYKKTLAKLEKLKPYEQALLQESPPTLESYIKYVEYELKEGEPARIQCLFERAIKDQCLQPDIWTKYLLYLDEELKIKSLIIPAYERSIRNCPWSVDIWLRYIRAMERHQYDHNDIKGIFETALGAGFSQGSEYLLLWTGYCDYLRRRIDWNKDHEKELDVFRICMDRSIQHLYQMYGNEGDPICSLHQFWAVIEARYCKNMTKSRELWSEIMTRGHGNEAKMWLEYLTLERSSGDSKHCRKLLHRAVNSVTDWPEVVCEAYINFEREEGSLVDYDNAVSKCRSQLERIEQRQQQQRGKDELHKSKHSQKFGKKAGKQMPFPPRSLGGDGDKTKADTRGQGQKRKFPTAAPSTEPPQKSSRTESGDSIASSASESSDGFKKPAAGFKKPAPPPGYKSTPSSSSEAKPSDGDQSTTEHSDFSDPEKNERTVFVSNLSFDITEEQVRKLFMKCGIMEEVRLIMRTNEKSKGFCYIEFAHSLGVAAALGLDRTRVENRPMYVSVYKPKTQKTQFRYQTAMERNKLFIKNLPFTCTKEALTTIFQQHGELQDVRLVTYKSGLPKGLAYVVFVKEEEAALAVMKTDGLMIGEHTIEVAISNPPGRKAPSTDNVEREFIPTLGGGKKDSGRGKAHTLVSLLPRSVQKPSTSTKPLPAAKPTLAKTESSETVPVENDNESAATSGGMKSNEDFRNLLLKR